MKVSQFFNLGRAQPTLDFVDIDVSKDTPVFVDPHAIRSIQSDFTDECIYLVQNFFGELLQLAKAANDHRASAILEPLHEPNETHLGLSKDESQGRALGQYLTTEVWRSLKRSRAVSSGLIEDLEDTLLLIEGIGPDLISDVTTNIIRGPLIEYTQMMCNTYGINPTPDVDSGSIWNPQTKQWTRKYVELPTGPQGPLLFVPKAIVRRRLEYNAGEFYNYYILPHLCRAELNANTALVHVIKTKRGETKKKVFKKDVAKKYGGGKSVILDHTLKAPQLLADYRRQKLSKPLDPLSHEEIAATTGVPSTDWNALLEKVLKTPRGVDSAPDYEKAVEALLSAIFYPALHFPIQQHRIHENRKRIDITYTNTGRGIFFEWLTKHYSCAKIMVECKNYSGEIGNPELDQLSGRFSQSRGMVGIIVCREFDDKEKYIKRCRDTANDQRGYVIPLDDDDLKNLVEPLAKGSTTGDYPLLRARFDRLIM